MRSTPPVRRPPPCRLPLLLVATVIACAAGPAIAAPVPPVAPTARAAEDTLLRVEVGTEDAVALLAELEARGFDTLHAKPHGVAGRGSLEAIGSRAQVEALRDAGHEVTRVVVGRPFREIAAERGQLRTTPLDPATLLGSQLPPGYVDLPVLLADLAALETAYPDLARVVDLNAAHGIGPTVDGNTIHALKISDGVADDEDEPAFLLVSCYHAREVITPVLALDAATRLLSGYGTDPQITALVDGHELWIAPVWNPDGYAHCFDVDNNWRKNRRDNLDGQFGVDLNRNHAFGWGTACSGSSFTFSQTYKGTAPASEIETRVMEAFAHDRHFEKVLDYHSFGEEVLWGYDCSVHPLGVFLQSEATALSTASGYAGAERPPSAEGEHFHWQLATFGTHAFLTETQTEFQPDFADALAEAAQLWPGVLWLLERPVPLSGHVTDLCSGQPLEATVEILGVNYNHGEVHSAGGPFGRYHVFVPPGSYTARFSAPGYVTQDVPFDVLSTGDATVLDVALDTSVPLGCWTDLGLAKAGVNGDPALDATGTLLAGSLQILRLLDGAPSAAATLVFGTGLLATPFKGGVLVPVPAVLVPLPTDVDGGANLPFVLPVGTPSGLDLWFQVWIPDATASFGLSASNGLKGTTG